MNKDHLIDLMYLFKDGESTSEERAQLFENLAYSSELQNEFHDLVRFENALACNSQMISPRPNVKTRLFKKAGIMSKFSAVPYIINIALYSLLFLMGFLFNDMIASDNQLETPIVKKQIEIDAPVSIPTNSIENHLNSTTSNKKLKNEVPSYTKETKDEPTISNNNISQEIIPPEEETTETENNSKSSIYTDVSMSNIDVIQKDNNNFATYISTQDPSQDITLPTILEPRNSFLNDFEISASIISGLYIFPQRDETALSEGGLNNFLFGVNYRLTKDSYIGIEYGRETMDLYVQTDDQLILNQAQYYLMAKYGYSLSELEIFSGLFPYTEISIGSTSVGPIAKARLGLVWEAFNLLKIYGNLESTGLRYSYLGNPEYTGKLSFNYGITIKL